MEQSPLNSSSSRRRDESELMNLREWGLKAQMISRENTRSRRFSASNISNLREEIAAKSFRSNFTISTSTASSPGYTFNEEINPSRYTFTNALRALQARSVNTWECVSPEGFSLNSKWNEAEKYICNPLSGEVPMECLSAKTLSGRSFRNLTSRITLSAPLIYPSHSRFFHPNPTIDEDHQELHHHFPIKEKKMGNVMMKTRDMGTQSTSQELISSTSPTPTIHVLSSIEDQVRRSINVKGNLHQQTTDSPNSTPINIQKEVEVKEIQVVGKEEEIREREEKKDEEKNAKWGCDDNNNNNSPCKKGKSGGGCLSLTSFWMRTRQTEKHNPTKKHIISLSHITAC